MGGVGFGTAVMMRTTGAAVGTGGGWADNSITPVAASRSVQRGVPVIDGHWVMLGVFFLLAPILSNI